MAIAPRLFGAEESTDDSVFALLSDTHIAGNRHRVFFHANMTEHFEAISRELVEMPARPAGVFISGDCAWTDGALHDYHTFAGLLEPIRRAQMPVYLTLGNHDNRERFWSVLTDQKTARHPVARRQMGLVRTRRANWFILDSLERTQFIPGMLGAEQLAWLARTLDANTDKPALIIVHHNLGSGDQSIALQDSEKFFEIVRPRKQVKACFFGHTHIWNVKCDESGIHLVNLPPTSYVFFPGDPSGWVRAKFQEGGMRLELRCVDRSHKLQGQLVDLKWREA
jgi:Icc protein